MTLAKRVSLAVCSMALAAAPLAAQPQDEPPRTEPGTHLGIMAGAGTTPGRTTGVLSGIARWQINAWTGLEARGSWFVATSHADSFAADIGAIVNVVSPREVTPFVGAAFGLYRATVDAREASLPSFYRHRVAVTPDGRAHRSFTDPAFRLTAGVEMVAGRNFLIRPEASAILLRANGRSQTIGMFGMTFAYLFEEHPVTPMRQ